MLVEHELCYLYGLAAMAPAGPAVESGVYKGGSLSVWCGARGNDPVYAVDTWRAPKWDCRAEYDDQIARHDLDVITLVAESWDAPQIISKPLAFAFIDATHGEEGFPYDMAAWPDAIMPGGILAFHDYGVWKPTVVVKQYVDAWQARAGWYSLGVVGSIAAFMRPRGVPIGGTR
jgi:hypothetical protein